MSGAALPVHQHVSNSSGKLGVSIRHFTLQQIRIIGKKAGLMDGAFARRIKDLSDEERLDKIEKDKDAAKRMRELAQISYFIGEQIIKTKEIINEKIDLVNKVINEIEQTDKNNESIKELKAHRNDLKDYKNDLNTADRERMQTKDEEGLNSVKDKVQKIIKNVSEFSIKTVGNKVQTWVGKFKKKSNHDGPDAEAP